jgi:hypothetical protein
MSTFSQIVDHLARIISPNPSVEIQRTLEHLVLNYRSLFIRREYDKTKAFHDDVIQTIPEMVVNPVESFDIISHHDSPVYYRVYQSELKLPALVNVKKGVAIPFVGSPDRKYRYNYVSPEALNLVKYSRYTKRENFYTVIGGKIYLINPREEYGIRAEIVLQNPADLFDYTGLDGERLYDIDHEFPVSRDMEQLIYQSILSSDGKFLNPQRPIEIHADPQ